MPFRLSGIGHFCCAGAFLPDVADSGDELSLVSPLKAKGFTLQIREPDWYEHRLLKSPENQRNLHAFSDGCEEIEQMLLFRDRMRNHPDDRLLDAEKKRELAASTWKYAQNYADAKSEVVQAISRNFCAPT